MICSRLRRLVGQGSALVAASIVLAGCANVSVYRAASSAGELGYTDKPLPDQHFLITFTGTRTMQLDEVKTYLRRREAEVTLREGYSHFVIFDTRNEAEIHVIPSSDYWDPELGYLAGYVNKDKTRMTTPEPGTPNRPWVGDSTKSTRYTAFSEIIVLKDADVAKNPDAQSARDILDRMMVQPPP